MRFMFLLKADEQSEAASLPDGKIVEAMLEYNDELVKAGALLAAEGLRPSAKGARIKFAQGKPVVTDGPFAEAKELVAGYWLIRAQSQAEAIEWAKRAPLGSPPGAAGDQVVQVEVRRLYETEDFVAAEDATAWLEAEEQFRAGHPAASLVKPGRKQFIVFRMADQESEAGGLPSAQMIAAMGAYNNELIEAGVVLAGEGLRPSAEGARVNFARGQRTVVDGPFTEAKELIAGFTLLQVASREEAIDWARRWPALDGGGEVALELREVFTAEDFAAQLPPELRQAEERQRAQIAGKL